MARTKQTARKIAAQKSVDSAEYLRRHKALIDKEKATKGAKKKKTMKVRWSTP